MMLLKIILDPNLDPESYSEVGITQAEEIYSYVKSASVQGRYKKYLLSDCLLIVDSFLDPPIYATISFTDKGWVLFCEYNKEDESGLDYISVLAKIEVATGFPAP